MQTLYFTPNYYFKGGRWTDELKKSARDCFMTIRSEWVEMVKPYISFCNEAWDKAHPELKNVKMEGEILERYDRYMSEELDNYLLTEYGEFPGNDNFYGHCHPDYPDFRLVYRHSETLFVDYDMTPIEGPT